MFLGGIFCYQANSAFRVPIATCICHTEQAHVKRLNHKKRQTSYEKALTILAFPLGIKVGFGKSFRSR